MQICKKGCETKAHPDQSSSVSVSNVFLFIKNNDLDILCACCVGLCIARKTDCPHKCSTMICKSLAKWQIKSLPSTNNIIFWLSEVKSR